MNIFTKRTGYLLPPYEGVHLETMAKTAMGLVEDRTGFGRWHHFNPFHDNSDAFELMVCCGLTVTVLSNRTIVSAWHRSLGETSNYLEPNESYLNDAQMATRYAIVYAAASVGELQEESKMNPFTLAVPVVPRIHSSSLPVMW